MDEQEIIESKYRRGELSSISDHLLEFVERHRKEILDISRDSRDDVPIIDATKQIVQLRGSIHLPSEMADQIREINNEIWYRGEHGDYDRSKIQEEWAMKYASMWRSFRIKEILYVIDRMREPIEKLVQRKTAI